MAEPGFLSIAEASRGFASGTLSPVMVIERLLERIDRLDGELHALLSVDAQGALAQARLAESEFASGRRRGPLHGVAIVVKDIIDIAGHPTTCHSAIPARVPAVRDASVIQRLREAGAIFLGKTSLHEFATGGPAFDLPWPPARNPWNVALHPGGSSSGSACAVAAGLASAALGTDTGGSVRHPATCCGVVGLKPTYDLVDRTGVFPLAFSLDHVGFLTHTVEDSAMLLDAVAGPSGGAVLRSAAPTNRYSAELAEDGSRGIGGLRVGVIAHFYTEDEQADPPVQGGIDAALEVLGRLGARVQPVRLSPLAAWTACGRVIQQAEQYTVHERWLRERPQDYCALSRRKLVAGAFLSASEYVRALQTRRILCDEFDTMMQQFDVLVTASGMTLPCAIDDPDAIARTYERHARMPFNLTGTPALSLPIGFTPDGLPLGMQVAARAHDERMLFRVAAAYENATRWRDRRPAL